MFTLVDSVLGRTEELADITVEVMAQLVKPRAVVVAPLILRVQLDFYQHFREIKHQFYWLRAVVAAVMMHLKVAREVE
jgi:hypothetical protein